MRLTKSNLLYNWDFQEKCNEVTGYSDYFWIPDTGDHLCIFYTGNDAIISVDATDGKKEWKSNFDFAPPIKGFHKGFYQTARIFYDQIKSKLPNTQLTFIGHSRGGGIAPILEYFARLDGFNNTQTITYAAPRCATLSGYNKLKKAECVIHRVEAKLDIVDNVPPRFTLFPFAIWKHFSTEVYKLPGVKGCDHAMIRRAIEEFEDGE